ncbi:YybH family protein [Haloechinothrix halophila]|uniref:YybH family protein n=1 Tax=Haloechinothrix halophila TaxID=1069073 RepID=UPI00041F5C49|nr:nuclear transport factor 2 family protein [Haloechinothrix halophila]
MTERSVPGTPGELLELVAAHAATGDVDALVALHSDDAVFQPEPAVVYRGHDEIRAALKEFTTLNPRITYHGERDVVQAGTVALVASRWSMTGTAPDGSTVREGGLSADVLRQRDDGSWCVVINQPRGEPIT